jgi:hypothetical protein
MEIDNEIKDKVFALYLGQRIRFINSRNNDWSVLMPSHLYLDNEFKIILKPLSAITDEDAVEVAQIIMGGFEALKNGKAFIKQIDKRESMVLNFHPLSTLQAFQFLQSKGYDLPNYLLGGKTLHECNLAIYENEN